MTRTRKTVTISIDIDMSDAEACNLDVVRALVEESADLVEAGEFIVGEVADALDDYETCIEVSLVHPQQTRGGAVAEAYRLTRLLKGILGGWMYRGEVKTHIAGKPHEVVYRRTIEDTPEDDELTPPIVMIPAGVKSNG